MDGDGDVLRDNIMYEKIMKYEFIKTIVCYFTSYIVIYSSCEDVYTMFFQSLCTTKIPAQQKIQEINFGTNSPKNIPTGLFKVK